MGGEGGWECRLEGGRGAGFSGGSGIISTVIWQGCAVMKLEILELNFLKTGGVGFWLERGHDSSACAKIKPEDTSLPIDVGLWG